MPQEKEILEKAAILNNIEFLSPLSSYELEELAADFKWQNFRKDTDIIREGQKKAGFFVLVDGKVEAVINRSGSQPLIKKILGKNQFFGEDDLFVGKPSTVTVHCMTDCKVLKLDAEHFAYMLMRWPQIYQNFTKKLYNELNQANIDLLKARYREFVRTGLKVNQLKYEFYGVWGNPETTKEMEDQIRRLAKSKERALLIGERGTGQQMMAWFVHKQRFGEAAPFIFLEGGKLDQQRENPFYEIMDFPGRSASMNYFLDISEGGTLFIRDINHMSPRMQETLAKALEAKNFSGWLVGTLNSPALTEGLIPRLRKHFTFQYTLNPLRKRKEDILFIAEVVLEKIARKNKKPPPVIDDQAKEVLLKYTYRDGNITELIQIIERAFFLTEGTSIGVEHLFLGRIGKSIGRSINLLSFKKIKFIILKGIFPAWLEKMVFFLYWLLIGVLLFAPAKVANYSLTLIWGLWWPLMAILAFWVGRIWCSVCPFSSTMEFVQKFIHFNKPVPKFLKKYDYLFFTFLFVLFPWLEEIAQMRYSRIGTALWLIGVTTAVILAGIVFTRHTWCRHLCPLGGYIGMASLNGMIEIRADSKICLDKCTTHDCYRGAGGISGCPMSQHTAFLDTNNPCKLCMRCVRTCRRDAIQVNLRVPAREVWHLVRVNQGFTIYLGTGLAVLIPTFLFEPYLHLWPLDKWRLWFTIGYWGAAIAGAGLTWLLVRPFKTPFASKRIKLAFAFVPIVIAGNIVYQLNFVPGIQNFFIGFGIGAGEMINPAFATCVPLYKIGQVAAIILGSALTAISVTMVLVRSRKKRTGNEVKNNMNTPGVSNFH